MLRFVRNPKNRSAVIFTLSAGLLSGIVAVSITTRLKREEMLAALPDTSTLPRSPDSLVELVERSSLMGDTPNVLQELDDIRRWHQERGYKGGVVLRELAVPLFRHSTEPSSSSRHSHLPTATITSTSSSEPAQADSNLQHYVTQQQLSKRSQKESEPTSVNETCGPSPAVDKNAPGSDARHCYYLYYERKSDGHMLQQVFCRGTTLFDDVITNLKALYVYDEELDCYLHMGFRDHANLLLQDLEPLLVDPENPRATVEMCGHSLGGVAAIIVALKLRKRGYKVNRLTTFGSPRPCASGSVATLTALLPPDTLRVEDESDMIPFLPLGSGTLGSKLWLLSHREGDQQSHNSFKFIHEDLQQQEAGKWVNSTLFNLYFYSPEIILNTNTSHRALSYETKLKTLARISALEVPHSASAAHSGAIGDLNIHRNSI